jgi:hypothetical protein
MTESEKFGGDTSSQDHKVISFLNDLQIAKTINFFEMREREIKESGAELPENIEKLRKQCLQRNKKELENKISLARTDEYKQMQQVKLNEIKKRLEEIE